MNWWKAIIWIAVALLGASALAGIALWRGEAINSVWLVIAAVCTFSVSYRFYGAWISARILALNDQRATPAERLRDGRDFEPTNKWIVLGHHFAAIAGPGPLVGPTLAAQFGYLPGTLWIVLGCALGGAVHDLTVLFCSMRRDGKSLGQMAKEEIGPLGGFTALVTVLLIMIILLAVVGLVVVNALKGSPWGTFTIVMTMPVAIFMGLYLRYLRPGKVAEVSILGFLLILASIFAGEWVANHPVLGPAFTFDGPTLAIFMIVYGFAASALPVWLLLAPRDYISTMVKLGVAGLLALGVLFVRPDLQMPALTSFVDGTGPIFAGKVFPFVFITIGCGAISGFHALISSGVTPKIIAKESHALPLAYGAMLIEGVVAILALIAATAMNPGVYFAVNSPAGIVGATPEAATATISSWGYAVTATEMATMAQDVGEKTLFARTGGAPSLALGMAHIFAAGLQSTGAGKAILGFWYHFAIMFEALFILTVIDAGTRVGRFMLQDFLGHVWKPLGRTAWMPGVLATSAIVVLAWGFFLYQGVLDPLGGVNTLWPLFGIANQLLAAIGLCVATTVILKMHGPKYMWVTVSPLVLLLSVCFTAGLAKIFSDIPRLGFLARAAQLEGLIAAGKIAPAKLAETQRLIFNERLDAVVCGTFLLLVLLIVADSVRLWASIISGRRVAKVVEAPFVLSQLKPEEI